MLRGGFVFCVNTVMVTIPFKALRRFLNERILLSAPTARDQVVSPVEVEAIVMQGDPYSIDNGIGPDASKPRYSVTVEASAVADLTILPGAFVAATPTRPKLMATSVHRNSESIVLDCTAAEGAA